MQITVNIREQRVYTGVKSYRCAIGKGGAVPAEQKTEGDGATPLGRWPLRRIYYRPDRTGPPQSGLERRPLGAEDGWCDAPLDPFYNRPVTLPYPASHERLWRTDHAYDVIVELGHNDTPPIPYRGSAVFMHVAKPDFKPTEGCIALRLDDLLELPEGVDASSFIDIRAD